MAGDGMLTNLGRLEVIKIVKEFNREVIALAICRWAAYSILGRGRQKRQ